MSNLLRCPCCGAEAEIPAHYPRHIYIRCTGCALTTDVYDTEEQAVAAWNLRAKPDAGAAAGAVTILRLKVVVDEPGYREDIQRIQAVFAGRGFHVDAGDIDYAYRSWSEETYCASWLMLSSEESWGWLFDALRPYFGEAAGG